MRKPKPLSRGSPYATGGSIAVTAILAFTLFALSKPAKEIEKAKRVEPVQKQASVILANAPVSLPPPPAAVRPISERPEKQKEAVYKKKSIDKTKRPVNTNIPKPEKKDPLPREVLKKKEEIQPKTGNVLEPEEAIEKGRASLRLLEHGKEEMVNLVWPENPDEMERLYTILKSRLGMQTVLIDRNFRIYSVTDKPGHGSAIDRDRFSTIIRSPEGQLPRSEALTKQRLFTRHHAAKDPLTLVRIFPRMSDALLLGAIERLRQENTSGGGSKNIWIVFKNGTLRLSDSKNNAVHVKL